MSDDVVDLVVVGAGLSGLAAAWRAHAAGRSVVVLEASSRVGGVIRTEQLGPYRVERAAASFPSTAKNLLALLFSLPKAPAINETSVAANRQMLWTRRGLVALERHPLKFALSGVLPAGAVARLFAESLIAGRRSTRPETLYALVRRRFGRHAAERLLKPMTLGVYGSDPNDLGAEDAFPAITSLERSRGSLIRHLFATRHADPRRVMTFEGGMEAFPRAIAAALGERVRTGAAVASLERGAAGIAIRAEDGSLVFAREVVLATTAPEQERLVAPLSSAAAGILSAVMYVPMAVVAVGIPPGGSPPLPEAFGFLKAPGAPARILGVLIPSVVDPAAAPEGHALLTVFVGGGSDPEAVELADDAVRAIVLKDLSRALGGPVAPDLFSIHRWRRAIPVPSPGHRARMDSANRLLAPDRVRLSGSHVTGVSVDSCCAAPPDVQQGLR